MPLITRDGMMEPDERPEAVWSGPGKITDVAIEGRVVIVDFYDDEGYWANGREGGKDYRSAVLTDPTWADLMVVANEIIETTKDWHHIFLETVEEIPPSDLEKLANSTVPAEEQVRFFYLFLGS